MIWKRYVVWYYPLFDKSRNVDDLLPDQVEKSEFIIQIESSLDPLALIMELPQHI